MSKSHCRATSLLGIPAYRKLLSEGREGQKNPVTPYCSGLCIGAVRDHLHWRRTQSLFHQVQGHYHAAMSSFGL